MSMRLYMIELSLMARNQTKIDYELVNYWFSFERRKEKLHT